MGRLNVRDTVEVVGFSCDLDGIIGEVRGFLSDGAVLISGPNNPFAPNKPFAMAIHPDYLKKVTP